MGREFQKADRGAHAGTLPHLTKADLERIKRVVTDAEYYIYSLAEYEMEGKISCGDIGGAARDRFGWIDPAQLGRLINIGMFYARK